MPYKPLKKTKMKKIALFAAALIVVSFTSCVKDRTCACTDSKGEVTNTTIHGTSSQAKTVCTAYASSDETCVIK